MLFSRKTLAGIQPNGWTAIPGKRGQWKSAAQQAARKQASKAAAAKKRVPVAWELKNYITPDTGLQAFNDWLTREQLTNQREALRRGWH